MLSKILKSQKIVTFVWIIGLVLVWEAGAFIIAGTFNEAVFCHRKDCLSLPYADSAYSDSGNGTSGTGNNTGY